MPKAEQLAQTLGEIKPDQAWLEAEISRLNQKTVMPLKQVSKLHDWLDAKRKARKSCRIIGESGTGKTVSCQSYVYRHRPIQEYGQRPIVPVAYVFLSTRCGLKDFFEKIIEVLKHRATKGTTSELRGRTREILKACHVEMLIIDEAQRLKPETFADVVTFTTRIRYLCCVGGYRPFGCCHW
jgi:DNA transposition AAA+ family ATPase